MNQLAKAIVDIATAEDTRVERPKKPVREKGNKKPQPKSDC